MKILYTGALFDSSGYAEASRNYVSALIDQPGIELAAQSVSFEGWKTNLEAFNQKVQPFLNRDIGTPDVHIVHLTPENFPRFRRPGVKTIGMTVWETDTLPPGWVPLCNLMDEIWVPCDWNVEVFRASGVTVPVRKIPHCIDTSEFQNVKNSESIAGQINSNRFNFYSIFQWSSRKNPEGLLRAYLSEFEPSDNVALVLKTYYMNNSAQDKQMIIDAIKRVKSDLQLAETPPVLLIHGGMSRNEILTIHNCCDCFVLPHRAEGWGVPHFEALAMGKPVISTGYGGNLEFMQLANSWLLSFFITPVAGMGRPTYNGKMHWAEPNLDNLQRSMREAYTNRELTKSKGAAGKLKVEQFNLQKVGARIVEVLRGSK
jgi:glycosyltransferase involved in cell wall biosynthesis